MANPWQTSSILRHSESVRLTIEKLEAPYPFGFGAAVCQRVGRLFRTSLQRHSDRDIQEFDFFREGIWRSLADLDEWRTDTISYFEDLIPSHEVAAEDNEYFQTAVMFYGLACAIEKQNLNDVLCISDAAVSLLDNFLYRESGLPVSDKNNVLVESHPWVVQEISRQRRDLKICMDAASAQQAIFTLWRTSSKENILDEVRENSPIVLTPK